MKQDISNSKKFEVNNEETSVCFDGVGVVGVRTGGSEIVHRPQLGLVAAAT